MVVVAEGNQTNPGSRFLLGRGENDGGKESSCCDAIFGPRTCITDAAVEVLHIIQGKRVGGRKLFSYDL